MCECSLEAKLLLWACGKSFKIICRKLVSNSSIATVHNLVTLLIDNATVFAIRLPFLIRRENYVNNAAPLISSGT